VRTVTVVWHPDQDRFEARGTHPISIPINAPHGGGPATGFSATELLLAGAGSCSTWDVVEIMRKARQQLSALEVEVVGDQATTEPWQYERLRLRYTFRGRNLDRRGAERAVALSVEKYCSVLATLRGVATVETEVVVEEASDDDLVEPLPTAPSRDDDLAPLDTSDVAAPNDRT
jgi:putative redox protein